MESDAEADAEAREMEAREAEVKVRENEAIKTSGFIVVFVSIPFTDLWRQFRYTKRFDAVEDFPLATNRW